MAKTDPKHSTDDPAHSARRDGHLTVPRCVPKGRVLAHNHVRHWDQHPNTLNGFRWWTWWEEDVPETSCLARAGMLVCRMSRSGTTQSGTSVRRLKR
jgi:hypothetical protein